MTCTRAGCSSVMCAMSIRRCFPLSARAWMRALLCVHPVMPCRLYSRKDLVEHNRTVKTQVHRITHITSHHTHHITSHHITPHHITSHHSHHITSHHITSNLRAVSGRGTLSASSVTYICTTTTVCTTTCVSATSNAPCVPPTACPTSEWHHTTSDHITPHLTGTSTTTRIYGSTMAKRTLCVRRAIVLAAVTSSSATTLTTSTTAPLSTYAMPPAPSPPRYTHLTSHITQHTAH